MILGKMIVPAPGATSSSKPTTPTKTTPHNDVANCTWKTSPVFYAETSHFSSFPRPRPFLDCSDFLISRFELVVIVDERITPCAILRIQYEGVKE